MRISDWSSDVCSSDLDKTGDFGIRSLSGKVIPTDIRALGNDQDMRWGLRIDVVEGKGEFILINLPAGNFAAQNLRKNILVIIGLGCVYSHRSTPQIGRATCRERVCQYV